VISPAADGHALERRTLCSGHGHTLSAVDDCFENSLTPYIAKTIHHWQYNIIRGFQSLRIGNLSFGEVLISKS
jgi:hypothetical protein